MFSSTILNGLRRSRYLLRRPHTLNASTFDLIKKTKASFLEWMGWNKPQVKLNSAEFVFFYGPKYIHNVASPVDKYECLFKNRNFFKIRQTVLYIHGYLETPDFDSIHVMVNAYAKRADVNFILLNWSELSSGSYLFDAVPNTKRFGPYMAEILIDIFDSILDIRRFHIVGHSLGGQLAGLIGREIYKKSQGTKQIKRISGLDPAFPLFYLAGLVQHLNKNDAEYVDIVHTDAWIYGYPFSTGHADFWPNGGKFAQPGVPKRSIFNYMTEEDLLSHHRSWRYWAESASFKYSDKFDAVQAKSWSDFKKGKVADCQSTDRVLMGINCPYGIMGDFFLQTNGTPPYARGKAGTVYVEPKELPGNECNENKLP